MGTGHSQVCTAKDLDCIAHTLGIAENFCTHGNRFQRLDPRGPELMDTWPIHRYSPPPTEFGMLPAKA